MDKINHEVARPSFFSPLFFKGLGKYAITGSLIVSVIGTILFCSEHDYLLALGAIFVGIGFSVCGYLIKSAASETPSGAAHNKIAINIGSLLSGVVLLFSLTSKNVFFGLAAFILFLMAVISLKSSRKKTNIDLPLPKKISKRRWMGWLLIGVAVGIKLFGILSVLPQYIIANTTVLPYWYGIILFISSGLIILFQLPIIHWLEKFKENNLSFLITLVVMISGMLLIAFPQVFYAYTLLGALIWTILLSIIECFASYLDLQASRAGYLLVKETAVGLGAGLTVCLSRYLPSNYSSMTIGVLGVIVIMLAAFLLAEDLGISVLSNYLRRRKYRKNLINCLGDIPAHKNMHIINISGNNTTGHP